MLAFIVNCHYLSCSSSKNLVSLECNRIIWATYQNYRWGEQPVCATSMCVGSAHEHRLHVGVPGPLELFVSGRLTRGVWVQCKPWPNPAQPSITCCQSGLLSVTLLSASPISLGLIRETLSRSRNGTMFGLKNRRKVSFSINCELFSPHECSYGFVFSSGSWERGWPWVNLLGEYWGSGGRMRLDTPEL